MFLNEFIEIWFIKYFLYLLQDIFLLSIIHFSGLQTQLIYRADSNKKVKRNSSQQFLQILANSPPPPFIFHYLPLFHLKIVVLTVGRGVGGIVRALTAKPVCQFLPNFWRCKFGKTFFHDSLLSPPFLFLSPFFTPLKCDNFLNGS